MFDRLIFVLGETVIGLRRNLALGVAAAVTTAISLYLLAGMAYVLGLAAAYANDVPGRFEMTINLKEGTDLAGIQRTAKYLRRAPGVASATWIPAKGRWLKEMRLHPELTEGYGFEDSPYPDAFKVVLNDLSKGDAVAATARRMSTVDPVGGVQYFREAQNNVAQWMRVARNLALCVGGLLMGVAGVLILNAIRLTLEHRRTEVGIMRLVGASRIVVALPFMLEGLLQGAAGGALAAAGLWASQRAVEVRLQEFAVGVSLAPFPFGPYVLVLCAVGGGYGGVCSYLALWGALRSRRR